MGFFSGIIYIILSFLAGAILILAPTGILNLNFAAAYINQNILDNFSSNITLLLLGVVIILLCLRYIQRRLLNLRKDKNISFESKEGKVDITLSAIEDMLAKMLEEQDEISHIKIKVSLRKKAIEVLTKGCLNYEVNLVDFTREIQEKVRRKIHILLGEDKKVQVNLQIRKIAVPGEKSNSEDPEVPFRHYK